MADGIHGSHKGTVLHAHRHEPLCLDCATFEADKSRAYGVQSGKRKLIRLSVRAVARILQGADPGEVLADEVGPQTLAALRRHRAGEQ